MPPSGVRMEGKGLVAVFAACTLLSGAVACTPDDPPLGDPGGIEIREVGWAYLEPRVGAAARLHSTRQDATGVHLRVTFLDENEDPVFTADGSVPRCDPDEDCWWGHTYPAGDMRATEVRSVHIEVLGTSEPQDTTKTSFPVRRDSDEDIVSGYLDTGGLVFVIGFDEHGLRWGMPTYVEDGARTLVPQVHLPSLGDQEHLSAFLQQGAAPPPE